MNSDYEQQPPTLSPELQLVRNLILKLIPQSSSTMGTESENLLGDHASPAMLRAYEQGRS